MDAGRTGILDLGLILTIVAVVDVFCGMWYVVCFMFYVVCGMWYVVCGGGGVYIVVAGGATTAFLILF